MTLVSIAHVRWFLCLVLVLTGCGPLNTLLGGGPATWPLSGGATTAGGSSALQRPVVVKLANDSAARPHSGLAEADLIIEIPVEGGITRLAVVFHSKDADHIGPVRSARSTDVDEASRLHAILVHVGASTAVAEQVGGAAGSGAFVQIDELEHPGAFERISDRAAPYNAYTSTEAVRAAAGEPDRVTVPALEFGDAPTETAPGESLSIPYGDPADVRYEYDSAIGAYHRIHGGEPTTDEEVGEVLPENVVIIKTEVSEIPGTSDVAGAPSLTYRGTGSGPVIVLRDGKRFEGTWTRGSSDMYRFVDGSGAAIRLKPGLTWIHIVPEDLEVGD